MTPFAKRFYTDAGNQIVPERAAASTTRAARLIAERERERFAQEPAARAIDVVDAAYAKAGIEFPDAVFRDLAIEAYHEGRPSFALRCANAAAETALSAVYRGEDLADIISQRAADKIGNPDAPLVDLLIHHAGRILPGLVPINGAAGRLIDETLLRLEQIVEPPRFREAAE